MSIIILPIYPIISMVLFFLYYYYYYFWFSLHQNYFEMFEVRSSWDLMNGISSLCFIVCTTVLAFLFAQRFLSLIDSGFHKLIHQSCELLHRLLMRLTRVASVFAPSVNSSKLSFPSLSLSIVWKIISVTFSADLICAPTQCSVCIL